MACPFTILPRLVSPSPGSVDNRIHVVAGVAKAFVVGATAYHMEGSVLHWDAVTFSLAVDWGEGAGPTNTGCSSDTSGGSTTVSFDKVYTTPGFYTFKLTATPQSCDASASISFLVEVSPPPVEETRWFCEGGNCVSHIVTDGSGYASEAACLASGCEDPAPEGPFACLPDAYGTLHCTNAIPADYLGAVYETLAECQAHCASGPVARWFCESGECVSHMVSDGSGFESKSACLASGCEGEPPLHYRWFCVDGECRRAYVSDPTTGYATQGECEAAGCEAPPTDDCDSYVEHPIRIYPDSGDGFIIADTPNLPDWTPIIHHTIDNEVQPNLEAEYLFTNLAFRTARTNGRHHFLLEWSRSGCPTHIVEAWLQVGTVNPGLPYWCVGGVCIQTDVPPTDAVVHGPYETALECAGACGATTDPCPPSYTGEGWYCVNNVPVHLATYEAWVAANKPEPRYPSAQACPCYVEPPPCDNVIVFDAPAANATLKELDTIVVHSQGPSPLASENPVTITLNGTPLTAQRAPGNAHQFFALVPAELGEWQGEITLTARLTHLSGCQSPLVTRTVFVHGTLLDDTRWGDILLTETTPHDAVQVDCLFDPATMDSAYFYGFAVSSPPPADSPPPEEPTVEDQLELETTWARLQRCALSTDTPLLGLRDANGNYTQPTTDAICRIRVGRQWKRIKYALAAPLTKIRRIKNSGGADAVLFYALPYIYKLDVTGFRLLYDLSTHQGDLGGALRDAAVRGGKTYVVAGNESAATFAIIDTDPSDDAGPPIDEVNTPVGAPPVAAFVDTMKMTSEGVLSTVRAYVSGAHSVVYERWPGVDEPFNVKRFELAGKIVAFHVVGSTVACVAQMPAPASNWKIYQWKRGDNAATLRYTSAVGITFISLESEAGALAFATTDDDLFLLSAMSTAPTLLVNGGFAPKATKPYNPGDGDVRAYGGDDNRVWWKHGPAFTPLLLLDEGESVVGMERWSETVVAGNGDPLQGGTPTVTLDSLLVAVHSDDANYILRYQRQEPGPLDYEGAGIRDLEFSSTLTQAGIVAGI